MQWPYGIGLDIGVASVGWAVVALNDQAQPCGLIRLGSRIFPRAEQPKTGESLAAPRRMARSMRRRIRRKALRKQDLYQLMEQYGLASQEELSAWFAAGHLEDIYALRTRALDEPVTAQAFARILLHLMQRRGFKSNRRAANSKEDGILLQAVTQNRQRMEEHGYRTVGEMLYKDPLFADHKRNKGENYLSTVGRDEIAREAQALFAAQRSFGQPWATPELEAEYLSILLRQRSFDEGPGGDSPYRGGWAARLGCCTLLPDKKRAFKNTPTFERFTLLQKINHLRVTENGQTRALTEEERAKLLALAYRVETISYPRIRKELQWGENVRFADVRYGLDGTTDSYEKKYKLPALKGTHTLRKALHADAPDFPLWDEIVTLLALHRDEDARRTLLADKGLTPAQVDALLGLDFAGTGHISLEACRMLEPWLLQGLTYDQACDQAGLDFRAHNHAEKTAKLPASAPELEDITSPVVRRAVSQTIKVVNAIIREMGQSPVWLHLELARELSRTLEERRQAEKSMEQNAAENERLMQEIRETFHLLEPTGQDLVKYRLWKEQDHRCAYSLQYIAPEHLFEPGYAEVDHIVPYSISFDDTRSNKVLVLAAENRQKGNRLPLQYLQGERREKFIVWTKTQVRNYRKQKNLLRESLSEEEQTGFKQRNLQDTQYMARFLLNYIRDHLAFADHPAAGKQRVVALAGGVTSHLRKRWGLTKVRADGDLHHALDATVIACATQGMVRQISGYYHRIEGAYLQEVDGSGSVHSRTGERFPAPWPHFRDELIQRLSQHPQDNLLQWNPAFYSQFDVGAIQPVFVSRMPQHKVTGAAHKETIKSPKALDDGLLVVKQPLTALTLDKKTGEIANYYQPSSDKLLYEALRARLQAFGGDGKKAFAGPEPFRKPKADGTPGPIVRKVKLYEKASLSVPVHGGRGAADNDTMVRVDVFYVPGDGYYLVPIYVSDTRKKELPNRAVVAHKSYNDWKVMKEEDFLFSLYPNDLIEVEHKKGLTFTIAHKDSTLPPEWEVKRTLCYYTGMNISTGAIGVLTHDSAYMIGGVGVKTLISLKKYEVDVLGHIRPVGKESRQRFR
ncbi:type II CRISPR RNA-guided endonuclease Cas9 [Subdoligranulum variabile]|uniref:type II CRISPR RNA-guided endonuclease Cas9 n=1 Tax=Subdoligranulum variabile TaxID=214851 RepID=UPI0029429512|nr:type II CRISPR RNA-guided endonuclease Cas9 [Subdoligranulum variabile]